MWLLVIAATLASGWFLTRALTAGVSNGPRWASLVQELALGALFGPGLASILFFALVAMGAANRATALGVTALLLAACATTWWRLTPPSLPPNPVSRLKVPWTWVLWIGVAAGLLFFLLDFQAAASANPSGEWDAISIWNLRAHYLASGDLWRRAVSSDLGGHMAGAAHPGYPLFLSSFLALEWSAAGDFSNAVPIATSLLFSVAALALLGASLANRKSTALGLLAWLILFASEVFASQTAAQYSDLLQGLAFLSALVLLDAAQEHAHPRMLAAAGLAIGLSCWIKNEGLPFGIAALAAGLWRFRTGKPVWLVLGALPGFAALAALKLVYVQGREDIFPRTMGEAVDKLAGAGRWWQAALGFAKAIYDAGNWWTHPVLLAALLALALRFLPFAELRGRMWLLIPVSLTAAAEYGLYLITTADLDWHISTSVSRLLAQLWPSLIWLFFLALRAPEDAYAPLPVKAAAAGASGSRRKRR